MERTATVSFSRTVSVWFVLLLLGSGWCTTGATAADERTLEHIVYTRSGSDTFIATLIPDHTPGSVPQDPSLVQAAINGKTATFQLNPGPDGNLTLSGRLPGLEDGRHSGTITTLTPGGSRKDRKQLLILVDSKPPIIERLEPESDRFAPTAGSIRFRISDPEDGSGVSPDAAECGLNVTVRGAALQSKVLSFQANELNLLVFVSFPGGAAEHGSDFTVAVSLNDRAGNLGRTSETFHVREQAPPVFEIYPCRKVDTYIQTAGEFLVEPSHGGLALTVGNPRKIDFVMRGCFGKNFYYSEVLRRIILRNEGIDKRTEPEIVSMNPFFQKTVGDLIEVGSASGRVEISRLEDNDPEDSRVSFRIEQKNPVPMGDQLAALQVTIPVAFRIDPARCSYCDAHIQKDPYRKDDSIYHHIPEEAFVYTFETLTIPVFMEAAAEPLQLSVGQEDDQLAAQVIFSPIALMDTGASWFSFDGDRYWFERQGDACVARGPGREGMLHYQIAAAHKTAVFMDLQGGTTATRRTMMNEGDILFCLEPPVIENFRYDREANALMADLSDRGTPLEDLAIDLQLSGYRLDADFDPETGKLTASLPYTPLSVLTASLGVTDLARQTTMENCQVFGEAGSPPEGDAQDAHTSIRSTVRTSPNTNDIEKVLGTTPGGKALVEICDKVMKWGYHENGRFIPIDHAPGTLRLVQLRSRDPGSRSDSQMAIAKKLPLHVKLMGESYDTHRYEPALQSGGGVTSLSMTGARTAGGPGHEFYYMVMARDGSRNIPIDNTGFGLYFTQKETKTCRVEERDILAPVIRPVFHTAASILTAAIHDHGMPLGELDIELTARGDANRNIIAWGDHLQSRNSRPGFTFQNGVLTSQFLPPPRGEFFTLQITAEDKAGNRSAVLLDVMLPREPPAVSLAAETQKSHQAISRYGERSSAFMMAEAQDDSLIVEDKTTLWLDDQVLRPFTMYSHTDEAGWRSGFHFKAGYAAGVEEGTHLARFRATDAAGLWAETATTFDFRLAPFIYDFKVMPDAVRKIGGPALTAMIIDAGGDLDIKGLSLTIDGQAVAQSGLFFDPESGYFSLDGPLTLPDGPHLARITATDRHGNQAVDSLRFTRAREVAAPYQCGGEGIVIEALSLMELEDHNGDGQANPGELVRLFISLRNDTGDGLACAGRLASEDPEIIVETESVAYGLMAPGMTLVPVRGFDLRIGRDILEKTISDPYAAHFDLILGCDAADERVLPLTLPIHRPAIPHNSGLALTLDRLPPTVTAGTYRVTGSVGSSAGTIDWMEIRINGALQGPVTFDRAGGPFEAIVTLAEGANTIEVTGGDSIGLRGADAGFVYRTTAFVPPAIAITSPGSGDYFVCDGLTVTGNYSTGSGSLSSITVDAPWATGSCPVTIIDGAHFSVDCGDLISGPPGIYDIEATITTTDGIQAVDTITISVGSCT